MVAIFPDRLFCYWLSFDEFYSRLIHEGKVGIMAGHVYGTEGEGYLRLNLACGREKLYMGLTRLVSVIKNINQGE